MQTKRVILHSVFFIIMTMDFSNSAQPSSSTDNAETFHGFSGSSLNNRLKRSGSLDGGPGDESPSNRFHENAGDDDDRGHDSEDIDTDKRSSNFVRIGRYPTMSRFVRIGRNSGNDLNDNDEYEHNSPESQYAYADGYPYNFDSSGGLDGVDDAEKRASSFVRIRKSSNQFSDELGSYSENQKSGSHFVRFDRAPSNFVRIGKAPSSFVRIGKAPSSFVRIGKAPSSFVRIGKAPSSFVRIGRAPSSFVRIGKAPSSFVRIGKAPSSFVRIGKAPSSFVRIGKAPSSFVRIGKSYFDDDDEKRARGFVRIGKNSHLHTAEFPDNYNVLSSGFVNGEKLSESPIDLLKRASSFVRIGKSAQEGKRSSSFVRIGKSDQSEGDEKKRTSSFVRIGKAELNQDTTADVEKRGSSFVRIGKSLHYGSFVLPQTENELLSTKQQMNDKDVDEEQPIRLANRGSAFVRIGKIPSSAFVRIGKNKDLIIDPAEYSRVHGSSKSTFVRIG
ncbi:hypothetical protein BsWGS_07250 [Bradybaena similaris]